MTPPRGAAAGSPGAGFSLDDVLTRDPAPFALLYRPDSSGPGVLDLLGGPVREAETLDAITSRAPRPGHPVLALVPYRMAAERGMDCRDDGAPLLVMDVEARTQVPLAEALSRIEESPITLRDAGFDIDDDAYETIVRRVLAEKIGTGEGANFVICRSFVGTVEDYSMAGALSIFRRLLAREQGSYWTFLVHTGDRVFVGATPERHITLNAGVATMNPISGTYRYPPSGPTVEGLTEFLADAKETDELYMVLDEELKMMGDVCDRGAQALGPRLKEMAHLAHTEYFITGRTSLGPVEVIRRTMFAPTVVGSPLKNAFRVVNDYEHTGRGHYASVVALIDSDDAGAPRLDSAILIRTAEISAAGRLRLGVGATLVRHSWPHGEVAETHAKAHGVMAAIGYDGGRGRPLKLRPATAAVSLRDHPRVRAALEGRNAALGSFWFADEDSRAVADPGTLAGRRVLVVDAEDAFTTMLGHQLRALGLDVEIRSHRDPFSTEGFDIVLAGPGPGDPNDTDDPRIVALRGIIGGLLDTGTPFMAVCLSHQVLSTLLGLRVARRDTPNQGMQREIDLFGAAEKVGFYNTFSAVSGADKFDSPRTPAKVQVCRDQGTGEVHALRGAGFASMQFHPESVLTRSGPSIIGRTLESLLSPGLSAPARPAEEAGR
jgi:2-amino-4-deoxychorismate synthase